MEWWKVNNVYGILGHYRINCSEDGQKDNVKSVQVSNDTLSAKLSGLVPNTRYKCTVEAFVLPNEQNLGGGYSQPSFERSPKTWPDAPTEPTEIAVTAVSSTAVKINWKAPLTPNGDISKYRVLVYEGSQNLFYETGPGALSYVLNGLQPYTTAALAVQAYTNPNSDGLGGGFGKISPLVSVTTKEAAPGPVQLLSCIHMPPGSPRLACSWSSPIVHNGVVRKYAIQLMDMTSHCVVSDKVIEDTYVTFKEAFDFTHVYQVSVAAVTVLEGEKTNVTVQLRTSNSNKSLAGLGATEETIVGAKATDPNYIIDEEGPAGSHGNITDTNLSGSLDELSGTSTAVPIESNEEETTREETSSSVAIVIAVTGIISLLALSTALYIIDVRSAMPHIPFFFGLNGRKVQSDYNINGPLEVKSNRSDSNRVYTKLEYVGTKFTELQTQSSAAPASSAPGLSTTDGNAADVKIIHSDEDADKRDSVGSNENTRSAVVPTSHGDLVGDGPEAPLESNENGFLRTKALQTAATIITVVGIAYLLVLATGFLQGIPQIPSTSDVYGKGVRTNHTFSGYLEPNSSLNAFVRMFQKEGYGKKEMTELPTQRSVQIPQEKGLPPFAIAATTIGIVCLLALVIGLSVLINRRRGRKEHSLNSDLVDCAISIINSDS
nr:unnamed protein product [Spirometra erinaceieuropaei]